MDTGTWKYAVACLKQGMTYANASRATGVSEETLRKELPGYVPASRPAPKITPFNALGRRLALLDTVTVNDAATIMEAAYKAVCEADPERASAFAAKINPTLPAPSAVAPRDRLWAIVDAVAKAHGLTRQDLLSNNRLGPVVRARQEAFWMLRNSELQPTFPMIGRLMGRDHTTVLHGVMKHQERVDRDAQRLAA